MSLRDDFHVSVFHSVSQFEKMVSQLDANPSIKNLLQVAPATLVRGRTLTQIALDDAIHAYEKVMKDVPDSKIPTDFYLQLLRKRDGGSVTAGNASGINDGAAAVVLASAAAVKRLGLKPMARLVAYGHAGVEPLYMGLGPIPATRLALKKAGLEIGQLDVIEANEAFAAQACAVSRELGFDPAKVNPNGSGISLGHPVGATGAIITVKAVHELARTGSRYALATLCIGGGQGIAAIFERAN